jgi:hypothetical protein
MAGRLPYLIREAMRLVLVSAFAVMLVARGSTAKRTPLAAT